jgi:hypothetical protein
MGLLGSGPEASACRERNSAPHTRIPNSRHRIVSDSIETYANRRLRSIATGVAENLSKSIACGLVVWLSRQPSRFTSCSAQRPNRTDTASYFARPALGQGIFPSNTCLPFWVSQTDSRLLLGRRTIACFKVRLTTRRKYYRPLRLSNV